MSKYLDFLHQIRSGQDILEIVIGPIGLESFQHNSREPLFARVTLNLRCDNPQNYYEAGETTEIQRIKANK